MADVVRLHKDEPKGLVLTDLKDGVLRLTLNNPPSNMLSMALLDALMAELEGASGAGDIRVVIFAAAGVTFSAGHDLEELTLHRGDADGGRAFFAALAERTSALMLLIGRLPQPVIAEIDGLATAVGCQLVAACDLAICTDSSTFCAPGINIGVLAAMPMVELSRAAHRKQAMEMLLTGETIDASTAKDFGLVNRIVPKQYLQQVVNKYAAVIAAKSPQMLATVKQTFARQAQLTLEEAYAFTGNLMADQLMDADAREGIGACLAGRTPQWKDD